MAYLFFNSSKSLSKTAVDIEEKNIILKNNINLIEKNISDSVYKKFEEGLIEIYLDEQNNVQTKNINITSDTVLGENSTFISGPIYPNLQSFISEKKGYISNIDFYLLNNKDTNLKWTSFKEALNNLNPSGNNFPMLTNIVGYMRNLGLTAYHISRLP